MSKNNNVHTPTASSFVRCLAAGGAAAGRDVGLRCRRVALWCGRVARSSQPSGSMPQPAAGGTSQQQQSSSRAVFCGRSRRVLAVRCSPTWRRRRPPEDPGASTSLLRCYSSRCCSWWNRAIACLMNSPTSVTLAMRPFSTHAKYSSAADGGRSPRLQSAGRTRESE